MVNENETLIKSIKKGINTLQLNESRNLSREDILRIIKEIATRGMPTFKKVSEGGKASIGEIGVCIALRALQDDFISNKTNEKRSNSIIPSITKQNDQSINLNLIIPIDPFHSQLRELRSKKYEDKDPDLLSISILLEKCEFTKKFKIVKGLKITPIEVKTRTRGFNKSDSEAALQQAKDFSKFLKDNIDNKFENEDMWSIAVKDLFISMLCFGFRIYENLPTFKNNNIPFLEIQSDIIGQFLLGDTTDFIIDIDEIGRLIVISESRSNIKHISQSKIYDTLYFSKEDGVQIFKSISDSKDILRKINNEINQNNTYWDLICYDDIRSIESNSETSTSENIEITDKQIEPSDNSETSTSENIEITDKQIEPSDNSETSTSENIEITDKQIEPSDNSETSTSENIEITDKQINKNQILSKDFVKFNIGNSKSGLDNYPIDFLAKQYEKSKRFKYWNCW